MNYQLPKKYPLKRETGESSSHTFLSHEMMYAYNSVTSFRDSFTLDSSILAKKESEECFLLEKGNMKNLSSFNPYIQDKEFNEKVYGKEVSVRYGLTNHMEIKANNMKAKPFRCQECGKEFSKLNVLARHMTVHTGEKSFKCNLCEKSFTLKAHLTSHLRIHTGEKPFKCNECGKCFSEKGILKSHMRIIHGEVKPFQCQECGKDFAVKSRLIIHMRIHTQEKPLKCAQCGMEFSQMGSLMCHISKIHT